MSGIKILDEATANKIAAGEVVERPASIVKELVENAVDAGADSITVEIEGGGMRSISVSDNGVGMERTEIPLAFLRHATSKIGSAEDLFAIETLGFRGEALPSIAAVSRVTLESCSDPAQPGYRYSLYGGREIEFIEAAVTPGTKVTVEELFYNTPARKKFLKSEQAEERAIMDIVSKLAIASPGISFRLKNEKKQVFQTRGSGNLKEALAYIFPVETTRNLLEVRHETDFFSFEGLVGPAFTYRSNRDMQLFYINNRYVRSQALTRALEEAYRQRIPVRKHPVGIIKIFTHAASVDVNIHPSKLEVKFSMEQLVCRELTRFVRNELSAKGTVRSYRTEGPVSSGEEKKYAELHEQAGVLKERDSSFVKDKRHFSDNDNKEQSRTGSGVQETLGFYYRQGEGEISRKEGNLKEKQQPEVEKEEKSTGKEPGILHPEFTGMEIVGTIGSTYILTRDEGSIYIIDQHAAHERVRYDTLKENMKNTKLTTQLLMEPVVLDLGYLDREKIMDHILSFEEYGILLELFGDDRFLLRGVPLGMENVDYRVLFEEILQMLDNGEDNIREKMLEMVSCRGAVKAGDQLSGKETRELLKALACVEFPYTCPHGRPTVIRLGEKELEKIFLRS